MDALHTLLKKLKTELQEELDRLNALETDQSAKFDKLSVDYETELTTLGESKSTEQTTLAQKNEALAVAKVQQKQLENSIESETTFISGTTTTRNEQMEQCDSIDEEWERAQNDHKDAMAVLDAIAKIIDERLKHAEHGVHETMDKALTESS